LERAGNQKEGSTSRTLEKPTKQELINTLNQMKNDAMPGDEVTFCFTGHGNGGKPRKPGDGGFESPGEANDDYDEWIWLNDRSTDPPDGKANINTDEILKDDELADMLEGFRESVTIVVVMESCFGGGFTGGQDDIQESDHVAVIGVPAGTIIDPPCILGGFYETLTEAVADGGGEREADNDGDGNVTAQELKNWLTSEGWTLGPPNDQNPGKIKKGKSTIIGLDEVCPELPSITPNTFTPSPGSEVTLNGRNFAGSSTVDIKLVMPDLTELYMGYAQTDPNGSFIITVTMPQVPHDPTYMLLAEDVEGNLDWDILSVSVGSVGGIVVPVDKFGLLAPYVGLASTTIIATVATALYVKRVKHRKEKQ
jgi:hypothetical protein